MHQWAKETVQGWVHSCGGCHPSTRITTVMRQSFTMRIGDLQAWSHENTNSHNEPWDNIEIHEEIHDGKTSHNCKERQKSTRKPMMREPFTIGIERTR